MKTGISFFLLFTLASATPSLALTGKECAAKGGVTVNNFGGEGCTAGKYSGEIEGMRCPCICCVGKETLDCTRNQVILSDVCITENALHLQATPSGDETPLAITLDLMTRRGIGRRVSAPLPSGNTASLTIPYEPLQKEGEMLPMDFYRRIRIGYRTADCNFPREEIPLKKCASEK